MKKAVEWVWERVKREPVLLGAAVMATWVWAFPQYSEAAFTAMFAWVTLGQRMLSTPVAKAQDEAKAAEELGGAKATAAMGAFTAMAAAASAPAMVVENADQVDVHEAQGEDAGLRRPPPVGNVPRPPG